MASSRRFAAARWRSMAGATMLLAAFGCSSGHKNGGDESDAAKPGEDAGEVTKDAGSSSEKDAGNTQTGKPDGSTKPDTMKDAATDSGGGGDKDSGSDAGNDAMQPDPCAGLQNACTNEGTRCTGNTLVTCAKNTDGCLVSTRTNCTRGGTNFCDANASPPACAIDPCAGVANACTTAGTSCDNGTLVECAANGDGCLVSTRTDCTTVNGKNVCSGTPAACNFDKCKKADGTAKTDVCATLADACAADTWVHCVEDTDGCPIATRTDCTMEPNKNVCDPNTKACAFDPCIGVTNCLTAGKTCDGTKLIECAQNADHCLVKSTTECSTQGANFTCDDTLNPVQCTTCHDATACAGKAEGDTICASNVFTKCTDSDNDTCLNAVSEDCGANFTCDTDATKRCVYSATTTCNGTIAATLRDPASYGPFQTSGGTNAYNQYTCAGLTLFPFAAASPDKLFAVDVAPKTTVTVTLTTPTGFTGNNAQIFLLTRCDDVTGQNATTAEATCQLVSATSVTYTNQGTTDTRVYVVVDAERVTANNTTTDSVGMFGLTLDSHKFTCGDGKREGNEACDDANLRSGDGCTPTCTLETGWRCTAANPSVCTLRPTDNICANVACPAVPQGTTACCTTDQKCGVAYALIYGGACVERNQEGKPDATCPSEPGFLFPMLAGCCRPDNKCGLEAAAGGGCLERTEVWANMQDGFGGFFYTGPFLAKSCTY